MLILPDMVFGMVMLGARPLTLAKARRDMLPIGTYYLTVSRSGIKVRT